MPNSKMHLTVNSGTACVLFRVTQWLQVASFVFSIINGSNILCYSKPKNNKWGRPENEARLQANQHLTAHVLISEMYLTTCEYSTSMYGQPRNGAMLIPSTSWGQSPL